MEYWNVEDPVFRGVGYVSYSCIYFIDFPFKVSFANNPFSHFPGTHYSIIPLFHYSNRST